MPAQPQDHESAEFTYELPNGATVTLPRYKTAVTFGRARRLRKLSEEEQIFTLIEDVCDDETLALLDELDAEQSADFIVAWQTDSQVTAGESPA